MNKNKILREIIGNIKKVLKFPKKFIPLHEPLISKNEQRYVKACLRSTFVSTKGEMVSKFEDKIKKFTKSKFAVAVINGSCGLHLALKILNVKKNDEVLVPSLTFVGTVNPILNCGAIPHFIDVEQETLGADPTKLNNYLKNITKIKKNFCYNKKTGRKISALIIVHVFGNPSKVDQLMKISKKFKIKLVEDAAEGIGSYYKSRHLGTFGDAGVISFNGNKTITTGGGGVLLTKNKNVANEAYHLIQNAKLKHRWEYLHDKPAFNYGMPAINASLGYAQLLNIKKIISKKRELFKRYNGTFRNIKCAKLLKESKNSKSNYWLQTLILDKNYSSLKEKILKITNRHKIMTRPVWKPMHKLKFLKNYPKMNLKISEEIYSRAINLPSSPGLIKGGK